MASVGMADTHSYVRNMDGRDDVHEFSARRSHWEPIILGNNAFSSIYESLNSS